MTMTDAFQYQSGTRMYYAVRTRVDETRFSFTIFYTDDPVDNLNTTHSFTGEYVGGQEMGAIPYLEAI